jgi:hypothetical protein
MAEAPVTERSSFGWSKPDIATPERATEYRTFARKIPHALIASGGAIAFIGALGAWIRATEVKSESLPPQLVGTLWGYADHTGRAIAIVAAVAAFIAVIGYFTDFLPRFSLEAAGLVLFAVLLARLLSLNSRSGELAAAAKQNPSFFSYNASFGWGAWLMLLAVVLVFLGSLVGALRELDIKRGLSQ